MLKDMVRKVREKDDKDYEFVHNGINRITKELYNDITTQLLEKIQIREDSFRLRITTLLFDTSVRQPFFAPLLANLYQDIIRENPEASEDLMTQLHMFDTLYDINKNLNVSIPPITDPGYGEAIRVWNKEKEIKRGFAVYLTELYARELIKEELMMEMVNKILTDLNESIRFQKSEDVQNHVDALVRFIFAVASKLTLKASIEEILKIPRPEVPCLNMKSRFKLEDSAKLSR